MDNQSNNLVHGLAYLAGRQSDACLYGIDPYEVVGRIPFSVQQFIVFREISKSKNGTVSLLRKYSYEAVRSWTKPIDFIYFDGDHSFEGVARDFRDWTFFFAKAGLH